MSAASNLVTNGRLTLPVQASSVRALAKQAAHCEGVSRGTSSRIVEDEVRRWMITDTVSKIQQILILGPLFLL